MSFEGQWHRHDDFELAEEQPHLCLYAQQFLEWAEKLCAGATQDPSIVSINQAKVLLTDKYMQFRAFSGKRHRSYTSTGHTCLFHVFEAAYDQLKVVELSLTPPMLFIPAPPASPPPPPQIAGVFIGELDEE